MYVGYYEQDPYLLHGKIDMFRVYYNKALSDEEMLTLAKVRGLN